MENTVRENIVEYLPDSSFNRTEILSAARKVDPEFRETLLRNLIEDLKRDEIITHTGRNAYAKSDEIKRDAYSGIFSEKGSKVFNHIKKDFPHLEFVAWELVWLNEFMNHQIAKNYIFIEVEKMGCGFIYDNLADEYLGEILLKPGIEDILRYGKNEDIIVDKLVSESPKSTQDEHIMSLEKLIVDLFANKLLVRMISMGDYAEGIRNMYEKYSINTSSLLRYARRRNKYDKIKDFLEENIFSK